MITAPVAPALSFGEGRARQFIPAFPLIERIENRSPHKNLHMGTSTGIQ